MLDEKGRADGVEPELGGHGRGIDRPHGLFGSGAVDDQGPCSVEDKIQSVELCREAGGGCGDRRLVADIEGGVGAARQLQQPAAGGVGLETARDRRSDAARSTDDEGAVALSE